MPSHVSLLAVPGSVTSARCGLVVCIAAVLAMDFVCAVRRPSCVKCMVGSAWVSDIRQVRRPCKSSSTLLEKPSLVLCGAAVLPCWVMLCNIFHASKRLCQQCAQQWNLVSGLDIHTY
jgi:hypothetical protein